MIDLNSDYFTNNNFNGQYSGVWFEYLRKNDSYDHLGDCNTVTFTAHPNGTIGIKRHAFLRQLQLNEIDETYAVFTDPKARPREGRWNISYQWSQCG